LNRESLVKIFENKIQEHHEEMMIKHPDDMRAFIVLVPKNPEPMEN